MTSYQRGKRRRGVLLLVVLAILAMLGLLAITFVMITGQAKRSARAQQRSEQYFEPGDRIAHEAFLIAVRGSENWACAPSKASLLEDMYGDDSVTGMTSAVALVCGDGQLVNMGVNIPSAERRVGCVLTALSGPAAGKSTRIVGCNLNTTPPTIQVVAFDGVPSAALPQAMNFHINAPPFSGTGAGFNPQSGQMDLMHPTATNLHMALLLRPFMSNLEATPLPRTQLNVDYTAVDYRHPLLAMQLPNGQVPIPSLLRPELVNFWFHRMVTDSSIIPWPNNAQPADRWKAVLQPYGPDGRFNTGDEFVRDTNVQNAIMLLKRKILFRPLAEDHPGFNGSNPACRLNIAGITDENALSRIAWELNGPWDVDNDGDGIADGIWVDIGSPVRTAPDGRLYKALGSYLCVDLDGRLNVNAHGTYAQTNAWYYSRIDPDTNDFRPVGTQQATRTFMFSTFDPLNPTFPNLPRGFGYGPGEINLLPLFGDVGAYKNLLEARYWPARVPGSDNRDGSNMPLDDPLHLNKWFEYPGGYWSFTPLGTGAYGSPPNRLGDGAIGLDPGGRPLYCRMGRATWVRNVQPTDNFDLSTSNHERLDDPYKANLSKPTAWNSPFSANELERVLRNYDLDASRLPSRLSALAGRRHEITTDSWDVPCPSPALPQQLVARLRDNPDWRNEAITLGWYPPRHVQDVLAIKIYTELRAPAPGPALAPQRAEQVTRQSLTRLLPLEMLSGLKMDLNRPFGNSADDNANGVIDEPGENETCTQVNASGAPIAVPFAFDPRPAVTGVTNGLQARQLYARHLYVLALLAMDHTVERAGRPLDAERDRARLAAQWAVNVVDFLDRDSIMTPFEYDICPFTDDDDPTTPGVDPNRDGNTWDVDGVIDLDPTAPGSPDNERVHRYRGLVWGCEPPPMLLTEGLAFHDRRTQDLPADGGTVAAGTDQGGGTGVADFDQSYRPEGSLFLEVYNPSPRLEPKPGEFYNGPDGGIVLQRRAPDTSPVWRLAIYNRDQFDLDPDNPDYAGPERSIYFVDATGIPVTDDGLRHYPSRVPSNDEVLLPGRFAVIGSGKFSEVSQGGLTRTFIGFRSGFTDLDDQTRRIQLNPLRNLNPNPANPAQYPVSVVYNPHAAPWGPNPPPVRNDLPTDRIQTPLAVAIDMVVSDGAGVRRRLSISEPFDGYPARDPGNMLLDETVPAPRYASPYLRPLDLNNTAVPWQILVQDGTEPRLKLACLQRLANPLLPWHLRTNPYRTVDSLVLDLTTFNGAPGDTSGEPFGGDHPLTLGGHNICSRERGENNDADRANNLWTQEPRGTGDSQLNGAAFAVAGHEIAAGLHHTLGYLNYDFGMDATGTYVGPRPASFGVYMGDPPGTPFPWLTWNNRPFISELELLLVPCLNARELLANPADFDPAQATRYPFLKTFGMATAGSNPYEGLNRPFPHLLNFFFQRDPSITDPAAQPPRMFHRLLEFVGVPSPFVGTEIQANPVVFANNPGHRFPPPFNGIPNYREPGRINLNTIFSPDVFRGLLNRTDLGDGGLWASFQRSRQGFDTGQESQYPTRFANPFRSFAGARLTPTPSPDLLMDPNDPNSVADIHATLLRRSPGQTTPLFGVDPSIVAGGETTNPDRNPFFRYQGLQRLGNLVTTRSNVYAVWITVGFFEVQPWGAIDAVHPDGYALGREAGSDTGEIKRYRAFYIFDRSIPVGFQRGQDLNVEKAILLKRFIE